MNDKVIVVVGASGGIGRVLSKVFVESGAKVVLSARNEARLLELQASLGEAGTLVLPADASNIEDVEKMFAGVAAKFGKVDTVVISAGTWARLNVESSSTEAAALLDAHFQTLLKPTFNVAFVAQRVLRESGGLIANISSHAAIRPELKGNLTYGPFKAAAHHLSLALREELKGTKVRVTDIMPAIVNTEDNATFLDTDEKRLGAVQPEAIAHWIVSHLDDFDIPAEVLFDSKIVL